MHYAAAARKRRFGRKMQKIEKRLKKVLTKQIRYDNIDKLSGKRAEKRKI